MNPVVAVLLVILLLIVVGVLPGVGYPHSYGYWPSGGVGLVLLILIILLVLGRI